MKAQAMEMLAANMIGTGAVRMITPQEHTDRWMAGPLSPMRDWLKDRPWLMRATGLVRIGLGVWLVMRMSRNR